MRDMDRSSIFKYTTTVFNLLSAKKVLRRYQCENLTKLRIWEPGCVIAISGDEFVQPEVVDTPRDR